MNKRLMIAIITGAILGVFCIIGAFVRSDMNLELYYLFSFWFNRLLMGLVIGLASRPANTKVCILRGIIFGGLVSFAFYSSTHFYDLTGFLAGLMYGIIIELSAYLLVKKDVAAE